MGGKDYQKVDSIDAAAHVSDLDLPGYELHRLRGKRECLEY
jgi:hypothetical protein